LPRGQQVKVLGTKQKILLTYSRLPKPQQ